MKRILVLFVMILALALTTVPVYAVHGEWRCGNLVVKEGVDSFKVLKHCGKPISKEVIGSSGSEYGSGSGMIKEKWVYGPYAGYYYIIYIAGGVVDRVESVREGN